MRSFASRYPATRPPKWPFRAILEGLLDRHFQSMAATCVANVACTIWCEVRVKPGIGNIISQVLLGSSTASAPRNPMAIPLAPTIGLEKLPVVANSDDSANDADAADTVMRVVRCALLTRGSKTNSLPSIQSMAALKTRCVAFA